MNLSEFEPYPKTPRLFREIVITEKLDGANAQIVIGDDGSIRCGSRNRWITPNDDNYGFARWCWEHKDELVNLGPGRHFGEWWGAGIQRGYGLREKRFSLFNVHRWFDAGEKNFDGTPRLAVNPPGLNNTTSCPPCCSVVPVLYRGGFSTLAIRSTLQELEMKGSLAAPGFERPEGIIVYHSAAQQPFKVLLEDDDKPKGETHV